MSILFRKKIIKNGKTKTGKQKFYCKSCNKHLIDFYTYKAYDSNLSHNLCALLKEGCGVRNIARLLKISTNTFYRKLSAISQNISLPMLLSNRIYEVGEMRIFIKRKESLYWIVLAYERESKRVVRYAIGRRNLSTIRMVIDSLALSKARKIYTDKLNLYKNLIPHDIHNSIQYGTNRIERVNLTFRARLKCLQRRSISFPKTIFILSMILKIFCFG